MNLKITFARYNAASIYDLLRIIDEVSNLYEINNVSYEYELFHKGESYCAKFKLYG